MRSLPLPMLAVGACGVDVLIPTPIFFAKGTQVVQCLAPGASGVSVPL